MTTSTAPARDDCPAAGAFVRVDDQDFYQISDYDCIPPFLMSIVSAGDHWMYVSSTGGLTIGRGSAESPFFPYQTVDKLHDSQLHTGPITLVRGHDALGEPVFWRPFSNGIGGVPTGSRRLLKSLAGDQVVFEETHDRLGLVFRYSWRTSTEFGFIRTASLHNTGTAEIGVEVVDGLRNICPSGVSLYTYLRASCLADAYKHNECDPRHRHGHLQPDCADPRPGRGRRGPQGLHRLEQRPPRGRRVPVHRGAARLRRGRHPGARNNVQRPARQLLRLLADHAGPGPDAHLVHGGRRRPRSRAGRVDPPSTSQRPVDGSRSGGRGPPEPPGPATQRGRLRRHRGNRRADCVGPPLRQRTVQQHAWRGARGKLLG